MKKFSFLIASLLFALCVQAQAPQKFSYQTVVRNSSNDLLVEQTVGIKISIIQGSANGSAVYTETHAPQTNANGLATLEIGGGSLLSGNFANINWANGPFFVKTETDPNGGNNYTITNTSQLLSVPYALNSGNGIKGVSATGDSLLLGNGTYIIIPGISDANNNGNQIGSALHSCGEDSVHNQNLNYGTLTDLQGNVYKTILIGTQEWMAENLKTSIYRNGEAIDNVTNFTQWGNLTTGAWCNYYNNIEYDCPYGKLYNWHAVVDSRNLCPVGWHVPDNDEWSVLVNYLDPNANGNDSNVAGGKMKSTGLQYWLDPNQGATNESGFSGLPGGYRWYNSTFGAFGYAGFWWSTTEFNGIAAYSRTLANDQGIVYTSNGFSKQYGFSVRCIRD